VRHVGDLPKIICNIFSDVKDCPANLS